MLSSRDKQEKKKMTIQAFSSYHSRLIDWLLISSLIAALILSLSACKGPPTPKASVEVQVMITEYKFDSSLTTFSVGTPYHFVLNNKGTLAHDWMIMPQGETDEDKALVKVEDSDLQPTKSMTKDFTFTQPGNYEFACHVQGHYEAGMVLKIVAK
jgi:plastocyanin